MTDETLLADGLGLLHQLLEEVFHLGLDGVSEGPELGLDGLSQGLELLLHAGCKGLDLGLDLLSQRLELGLAVLHVGAEKEIEGEFTHCILQALKPLLM